MQSIYVNYEKTIRQRIRRMITQTAPLAVAADYADAMLVARCEELRVSVASALPIRSAIPVITYDVGELVQC